MIRRCRQREPGGGPRERLTALRAWQRHAGKSKTLLSAVAMENVIGWQNHQAGNRRSINYNIHRESMFVKKMVEKPLRSTPPNECLDEVVCAAVFQYHLWQSLVDAPHPLCYYLARQGRDPSEALLGRLRSLAPGVQPFSQCRVSGREGVVDRTTGARGVILQVARLTLLYAAADAVGGYYLMHRQAAGFRYHLVPDAGQWVVTAAHLLWLV
jgi:hypothetical protein